MSRAEAPSELDVFLEELGTQPPENKFAFASAATVRIEEMAAFLNFVKALPVELKLPIMEAHVERYVPKTLGRYGLLAIFVDLPSELRLAFVNNTACRALIEDFNHLKEMIITLPLEARVALAEHYVDKIENGYQLIQILSYLSAASRAAFAGRADCLAIIKDASEVDDVLSVLPAASRMAYAVSARAHITNPIEQLSTQLGDDFFNTYLNNCLATVQNGSELMHVLYWVDRSSRLALAEPHLAKIQNGAELAQVLQCIPTIARVELATRFLDKIQNAKEFAAVMKAVNELVAAADSDPEDPAATEEAQRSAISALESSDAYVAKISECLAKLKNGVELADLLQCMPESRRGDFVMKEGSLAKIQNITDLCAVIECLPKISRLALMEHCLSQIETIDDLCELMDKLPENDLLSIVNKADMRVKITNGFFIANLLRFLPADSQLAFAESLKDRIQNGAELFDVLRTFLDYINFAKYHGHESISYSVEQVLLFAKGCRDKITSEEDLLMIFSLRGFSEISSAQRYSFVQGCPISLNTAALLSLKIYVRSVFNDPQVLQKFSLRELDPNVFLFSAAIDPLGEADFDYFLEHPLCSVDSLNEAAKTLVMHIEEQGSLSRELKDSRIAKVHAKQQIKRKHRATHYLGFNLSSLKQTELKFGEALPAIAVVEWPEPGLDPARIQRFRQLIQWLKTRPALATYQADFEALEGNTLIRTSSSKFNSIADELETFVATLALYLKQRKAALNETDRRAQARALASHLDASGQLGFCMEGVRSSLQSMTRSLNPGAGLANAVDVAVDQAIRVFIELAGISQDMEVHASKDWLLLQLGIDARIHHDPYRLPISPVYLKAIVRNAAGRLTPDFLIEQSAPSLESLQEAPVMVFNAATINLLERDWYALHTAGLLPENRSTALDRCIDVMRFIDSRLSQEVATAITERYVAGDMTQVIGRDLSAESLSTRYREYLEHSGVLSIKTADIAEIQRGLWAILTSTEEDLSLYDDFITRILNAPNGLAWVKAVIESHAPEERAHIKLKALLHCPKGATESLFRALACDPYSAGWTMAWELKRTGANLIFNPNDTGFLGSAMGELAADTALMHTEMEEIFVRPGNLLFWLGELQKDAPRRSIFDCILAFVSAQGMYRFDSLLDVLAEMTKKGNPLEKTTAQSFLEARCLEQKAQNLWGCYWKTACYLENIELKIDSREMLQSLKDPENARAALSIAETQQNLVIKITEVLATLVSSGEDRPAILEDFAVVLRTISGLFPAVSAAPELGSGAGASASAPRISP